MLGKLGLLIDPYEFPDVDRREGLMGASSYLYHETRWQY